LPDRIVMAPYVVDNEWWEEHAGRLDRHAVGARWSIPADAAVVLFCAKLAPWKRPMDVLEAFARVIMGARNARTGAAYLVYAGDGSLRQSLESAAKSLGVAERVRFLGFVNQSLLPEVYRAADVMVLPSEYEPFGVVVNEAMLCGCAVVVSDRVGARYDLVRHGSTGYIFPCGDIPELTVFLDALLADPELSRRIGEAARERLNTWSPKEYAEAITKAFQDVAAEKSSKTRRRPV